MTHFSHAGIELQQVEALPVGTVGGPLVSAAPAKATYIRLHHRVLYFDNHSA